MILVINTGIFRAVFLVSLKFKRSNHIFIHIDIFAYRNIFDDQGIMTSMTCCCIPIMSYHISWKNRFLWTRLIGRFSRILMLTSKIKSLFKDVNKINGN